MELTKLYTAPSVIPCDLVRSLLESHGIPSVLRNEQGSAAAGCGLPLPGNPSLPWAWPEVWVRAEDHEAAKVLIDDRSELGGKEGEAAS